MYSKSLLIILVLAIATALSFIIVYSRKNFFVKKNALIASNTTRGFALIADFLFLNTMNFLYIIFRVFTNPVYKEKFQVFAEYLFHNGGVTSWFWDKQLTLLPFYVVYSLICELTPLRSTIAGHYMGLYIVDEKGSNTLVKIIIRNLLKPISILLWPIAAFISNFTIERRWFHDMFLGLIVKVKL